MLYHLSVLKMDHIFKEVIDGTSKYNLSVEFNDNEFSILVLQDSNALNATISEAQMESQAKQVKKETKDYYQMLQTFFVNTPDNVKFILNGKEFIVFLDFKIKYFSCKLKKDNFSERALRLINKFYIERTLFSEDLKRESDHRKCLLKEKIDLENQLRVLVEKKISIENEMYSSFVMVLNEKKMRIQHLNELIQTFRQGRPTINNRVETKRNARSKKVKQEIQAPIKDKLSSSESEKSYNTDEEHKEDYPLSPQMPSTSKHNLELLLDESPDEEVVLPKRKSLINTINMPSTSKDAILEEDYPLSPQRPSTSKHNLELLSDESPDNNYALPKRMKITPTVNTFCMPSTSKDALKEEYLVTEPNKEENSHVVELSTQELLDLI